MKKLLSSPNFAIVGSGIIVGIFLCTNAPLPPTGKVLISIPDWASIILFVGLGLIIGTQYCIYRENKLLSKSIAGRSLLNPFTYAGAALIVLSSHLLKRVSPDYDALLGGVAFFLFLVIGFFISRILQKMRSV